MKGKLDVGDPRQWWQEALEQLAATAQYRFSPDHVAAVHGLPPIHQGSRSTACLIAQAVAENGLTLVTRDSEVARYAATGLRVVG
jgi:PIN domain nuclease of toxin-antitoxin system